MKSYISLLFIFLSTFAFGKGTIILNVSNLKGKGNLHINIYNNAENFSITGKEYRKKITKVNAKTQTISLGNMPNGVYAIMVFQDENHDGVLNKDFYGLPTEGYGFSNNFKSIIVAPSFYQTKFRLDGTQEINIKITRPKVQEGYFFKCYSF